MNDSTINTYPTISPTASLQKSDRADDVARESGDLPQIDAFGIVHVRSASDARDAQHAGTRPDSPQRPNAPSRPAEAAAARPALGRMHALAQQVIRHPTARAAAVGAVVGAVFGLHAQTFFVDARAVVEHTLGGATVAALFERTVAHPLAALVAVSAGYAAFTGMGLMLAAAGWPMLAALDLMVLAGLAGLAGGAYLGSRVEHYAPPDRAVALGTVAAAACLLGSMPMRFCSLTGYFM